MTLKSLFASPLALLLAPAAFLVLNGPWMSEEEIKAAFAGTTIDGHYRSGRTFTERYGADMRLEYRERGRLTAGHWSLQAGTFCTIYDVDPTGGCYRVARHGDNCYEFYFVARTEEEANEQPRQPDWNARGWRTGEKATCVDGPTV